MSRICNNIIAVRSEKECNIKINKSMINESRNCDSELRVRFEHTKLELKNCEIKYG